MSSYCKRCEGSGSVSTGIAEASESSCRACGGTGYAPTQGADARPVAIVEILNNWSIEHKVFLPQDFWEDLEKRLKGVS